MTTRCYIYYRVHQARLAEVRRAVMTLLDEIRGASGISGRLSRRVDDALTWMEVYEPITEPEKFISTVQMSVRRLRLDDAGLITQPRKMEFFVDDVLDPRPDHPTLCA